MKKLMIAAAIVCAAAVSQAATTNWSTGDVWFKGIGSELADDSGDYDFTGKAYLFWLTSDQYDSIKSGDAASIWNKFDASNNTLDFGTELGKATFKSARDLDEGVAYFGMLGGDAGNYYSAIIVTHEDGSGNVDAYSANTMYAVITQTAVNGADSIALGWGEKAQGAPTTWQSAQAVPEPTSGLLLLLGVAGLALRRRRA